ncbi:hypothetical protein BDY21DRAFT_82014 [Lineolata rhizophorae]|uniref:JmjC domain-containing protein n=1 Tax=Lineolata rhizophorae TaxID=578093 RepID=A0A6A6PBC8_9PEZI|nr:hypothetical protein BDY21DRAFT_82014 [Lineolata rhizophorae]
MPAQRPRASFEPLPPDFDVRALVENTDNFQYVDRISYDVIEQNGFDSFEKLVLLHAIIGGKPLVIDGFLDRLDPWTFTPGWLKSNHGKKIENARNLTAKDYLPLTIGHYLDNMSLLTDQFWHKRSHYKDKNRQRIYLKDIDCPPVWHDKLRERIPPSLFYMNDSVGDIGGPGAPIDNSTATGTRRKGRGIAKAADLMSSLPPEMRAVNLMCYVGHEGTYTPAHREMCASMGQNIMVEASGTVGEGGRPEKPGSSLWLMTESKDRHMVAEYWLSVLGHDIEVESHFAQISAWRKAPFTVYVVEQRPGDFILIPPLAPHQVWNRGTRTMKVAWNRTTVETLEMAMNEALPNARMVCRDEQYKNKAIIYYTLAKYSGLLRQASARAAQGDDTISHAPKIRQVKKDFRRLFFLFQRIMVSEMFGSDQPQDREFLPYDSNVTCAYCRGNIFNRFLTCPSCKDALGTGTDEPYDICMECYAMGRSCACISGLRWVEQWKWKDLTKKYEDWRRQIIEIDGGVSESTPLSLTDERGRQSKKTLAQICQEQLKRRPWIDIKNMKNLEDDENEDEEIVINDDGTVKKVRSKKSKEWIKKSARCHVCFHRHPKWKCANCAICDKWFCYGSLFRGHDLMPQTVMEDPNWACPHCRRVCNAGACRRDPSQHPYEPKGTLLGHDTRKVADARSVESLVDFSVSNLNWLKDNPDEQPHQNARLMKRKEAADQEKANGSMLDGNHYVDDDGVEHTSGGRTPGDNSQIVYSPGADGGAADGSVPIDPALLSEHVPPGYVPSTANGAPPGYVPGETNGLPGGDSPAPSAFVAPSAIMYNAGPAAALQDEEEDISFLYPEPHSTFDNDGELEEPATITRKTKKKKKKRGTNGADEVEDDGDFIIQTMQTRKRSNAVEDGEVAIPLHKRNDASAQFRRQQEKKHLEEAKKAGRFIAANAALRGRKKFVKLKVGVEKLQHFNEDLRRRALEQQRLQRGRQTRQEDDDEEEWNEAAGAGAVENGLDVSRLKVLLTSDVAALEKGDGPGHRGPGHGHKHKKYNNQVRVPVEEDEDFATSRKRKRPPPGETGPDGLSKKKARVRYESISISSEDEEDADKAGEADGAYIPGTRQRRASGEHRSSRRNRGDEENEYMPTELPEDWRDSFAARRREPKKDRRVTFTGGASIRSAVPCKRKPGRAKGSGRNSTGGTTSASAAAEPDIVPIHGGNDGMEGINAEHDTDSANDAPDVMHDTPPPTAPPAPNPAVVSSHIVAPTANMTRPAQLRPILSTSDMPLASTKKLTSPSPTSDLEQNEDPVSMARIASRIVSDNMRAKLDVARWADDNDEVSLPPSDDDFFDFGNRGLGGTPAMSKETGENNTRKSYERSISLSDDDSDSSSPPPPPSKAPARSRASAGRAPLTRAQLDGAADDETEPQPIFPHISPRAKGGSILSRMGRGGKKIKIVSAASKMKGAVGSSTEESEGSGRHGTATPGTESVQSTPSISEVNRGHGRPRKNSTPKISMTQVVPLSSEDEDEVHRAATDGDSGESDGFIPAKKGPPQRHFARRGRPSRGGVAGVVGPRRSGGFTVINGTVLGAGSGLTRSGNRRGRPPNRGR